MLEEKGYDGIRQELGLEADAAVDDEAGGSEGHR
jgi:hypothetical protein